MCLHVAHGAPRTSWPVLDQSSPGTFVGPKLTGLPVKAWAWPRHVLYPKAFPPCLPTGQSASSTWPRYRTDASILLRPCRSSLRSYRSRPRFASLYAHLLSATACPFPSRCAGNHKTSTTRSCKPRSPSLRYEVLDGRL